MVAWKRISLVHTHAVFFRQFNIAFHALDVDPRCKCHLLFSTCGYITTRRTRRIGGPESPLKWIGTASKGGRTFCALVGNEWSTELSLMAPVLVACDRFARIRIGWNVDGLAGTQIALFVACLRDPGDRATSTMGSAVVEETGEGCNFRIAIGTEALIEGTRGDATKAQHRDLVSRRVVVAVTTADEEEDRQSYDDGE